MNVNVHSIHFDADVKLIQYIQDRLGKLEQFHDRILSAEVFLRLEHDSQGRENKIVEVKLAVPGKDLFAKRNAKTFEEATDMAAEALRRQVLKAKPRMRKAS
ncbi:MAG: ribosome-associated translation inhibitor RaiA [Flavobacteriales bacterium]|nr:ribosome-associated translation inhibitor RaiA [Flavobacteriales bacterium]